MRTVELSWEDEDWCFKLPCLLWECRQGATVRQARETDGVFVLSVSALRQGLLSFSLLVLKMCAMFLERHTMP